MVCNGFATALLTSVGWEVIVQQVNTAKPRFFCGEADIIIKDFDTSRQTSLQCLEQALNVHAASAAQECTWAELADTWLIRYTLFKGLRVSPPIMYKVSTVCWRRSHTTKR